MIDLIEYVNGNKPLSDLCLRNIKTAKIKMINKITNYDEFFCAAYELPNGLIKVKNYKSNGSWSENSVSDVESDFDIVLKQKIDLSKYIGKCGRDVNMFSTKNGDQVIAIGLNNNFYNYNYNVCFLTHDSLLIISEYTDDGKSKISNQLDIILKN